MNVMNRSATENPELERRLERLLGSIDVPSEFDAHVLQRIRLEAQCLTPSNRSDADARARRHYELAMKRLQLTRRRMFEALALDSLAGAAALILAASLASRASMSDALVSKVLSLFSQYSLLASTLLGILAVATPLAAFALAERRTHSSVWQRPLQEQR